MASGAADKKAEKSYLASAVDSINPWARGQTSTTASTKDPLPSPAAVPTPTSTGDHILNPLYGKSFKRYPPDCPRLAVQWFHAVDVPKRKPKFMKTKPGAEPEKKPPTRPKKFVAFSPADSKAIEAAYQKRLEELEDGKGGNNTAGGGVSRANTLKASREMSSETEQGTPGLADAGERRTKVPVNEDFLFDVDIEARELAPVYWLGPVYEVRRGSWFYQEGSNLRSCEENLAAQLEEGYLKVRPWEYDTRTRSDSATKGTTPKPSTENLKAAAAAAAAATSTTTTATTTATSQGDGASSKTTLGTQMQQQQQHQPQTHRLFGTYMNSVVTYQDANTAWLSSDGVLSWVTSTMYERFAGGGYLSGVKLVRGYSEPKKPKDKDEKRPSTPTGTRAGTLDTAPAITEKQQKALKRRSAPPSTKSDSTPDRISIKDEDAESEIGGEDYLTRRLSNLLEGNQKENEEAIRQWEEKQIQDDYTAHSGETQGREIEHVVLVTHGIGQLLSLRMESINFVHDVNVLRKTLKSVYTSSADLKALNGEPGGDGPGNCRVQVLPVCWRHLLEFPKRKEKRGEFDISEAANEEDDYPSLDDITVEGVAFARSLISDLALDVLLYQSAYREQISEIVLRECNRIYRLFIERNPEFKGKVHIMGHSLGSAILFDILCRQKEKSAELVRNPLRIWPSQDRYESKEPKELTFDFEVEDFYCLGSPIGLFQMLKGRTIAGRRLPNILPPENPLSLHYLDDPLFTTPAPAAYAEQRVSPVTGLPYNMSSPKCEQMFNIFHPSDPISYRLEPLVSPAMSSLKPQALPYTKKGIFGAVAPQGLTGIGTKVGQSVSGLWSSFSAGIANSLLNRSLGLTQEDVNTIAASQQQQQQQSVQHHASPGAGTNISAGGVISSDSTKTSDAARAEKAAERKLQLAEGSGATGKTSTSGNEMTLLDDELETLFSRFQKKRADLAATRDKEKDKEREKEGSAGTGSGSSDAGVAAEIRLEEEQKAQKLRREEMKMRALNRNGRVDYCIQESVLDFNPMNTIASHMSYWQDEDVVHFVLSQLLASKKKAAGGTR